ncbi:phage major tail tube protein [Zooshikella sp. RANM57]|uniref:phage major tail tube protein n=1 Tax=Zooshikella sp. RANM57 TaxID=3425863 RepID=UPI003D6E6109
MLPQTIRFMNLFVDGKGYAGVVEEVSPPKLTIKTEEFKAGGMDAPLELDQGMEKLECSFTIASYDSELFKAYGLVPGKMQSVTLRGAIEQDQETIEVTMALSGSWKEFDFGTWKSGEKVQLKVSVSLKKYELRIKGEEKIFIDIVNMVRRLNGVDVFEAARSAIGV